VAAFEQQDHSGDGSRHSSIRRRNEKPSWQQPMLPLPAQPQQKGQNLQNDNASDNKTPPNENKKQRNCI
jgi:hypothetical protein